MFTCSIWLYIVGTTTLTSSFACSVWLYNVRATTLISSFTCSVWLWEQPSWHHVSRVVFDYIMWEQPHTSGLYFIHCTVACWCRRFWSRQRVRVTKVQHRTCTPHLPCDESVTPLYAFATGSNLREWSFHDVLFQWLLWTWTLCFRLLRLWGTLSSCHAFHGIWLAW